MSKNQNVVTPVTAKVENVEVPELVVAVGPIEVLLVAIAAKSVTPGQFANMKLLIETGKLPVNLETLPILQYVAKGFQKIQVAANNEQSNAAAKKLAEATFAADVQKYEIQVAEKFGSWYNKEIKFGTNENETDSSLTFVKLSKDALKTSFANFFKNLPAEPKKPGSGKKEGSARVSDGSTVEKKHMTDVTNLQPGTKKTVWEAIVNAPEGISQTELEKVVQTAFPEKSIELNKANTYKALYYLPEFISDGKLFAAAKVA